MSKNLPFPDPEQKPVLFLSIGELVTDAKGRTYPRSIDHIVAKTKSHELALAFAKVYANDQDGSSIQRVDEYYHIRSNIKQLEVRLLDEIDTAIKYTYERQVGTKIDCSGVPPLATQHIYEEKFNDKTGKRFSQFKEKKERQCPCEHCEVDCFPVLTLYLIPSEFLINAGYFGMAAIKTKGMQAINEITSQLQTAHTRLGTVVGVPFILSCEKKSKGKVYSTWHLELRLTPQQFSLVHNKVSNLPIEVCNDNNFLISMDSTLSSVSTDVDEYHVDEETIETSVEETVNDVPEWEQETQYSGNDYADREEEKRYTPISDTVHEAAENIVPPKLTGEIEKKLFAVLGQARSLELIEECSLNAALKNVPEIIGKRIDTAQHFIDKGDNPKAKPFSYMSLKQWELIKSAIRQKSHTIQELISAILVKSPKFKDYGCFKGASNSEMILSLSSSEAFTVIDHIVKSEKKDEDNVF